jgi:hypothetical protein
MAPPIRARASRACGACADSGRRTNNPAGTCTATRSRDQAPGTISLPPGDHAVSGGYRGAPVPGPRFVPGGYLPGVPRPGAGPRRPAQDLAAQASRARAAHSQALGRSGQRGQVLAPGHPAHAARRLRCLDARSPGWLPRAASLGKPARVSRPRQAGPGSPAQPSLGETSLGQSRPSSALGQVGTPSIGFRSWPMPGPASRPGTEPQTQPGRQATSPGSGPRAGARRRAQVPPICPGVRSLARAEAAGVRPSVPGGCLAPGPRDRP